MKSTEDETMQHADSKAQRTRDHDEIRKWTEARWQTGESRHASRNGGILRIDFGEPDEGLTEISWEDFFAIFDENKLEFLYQEKTEDGHLSRFNKFVNDGD